MGFWWISSDHGTNDNGQMGNATMSRGHRWTKWWKCSSMHEEVFWRSRLSAAFRTGWACLMAGVILQVGSMHVQWVTFPIFAYVMAVTVVGESTVGKAIQDALAVVTGTTQGVCLSLLVLQVFPPRKYFTNIGFAIACIAITSFITVLPKTTPSRNILHKRIALAHSAIIYVTAVVQGEHMDEVFFPLKLAGTTVVGATCGMLALVLPFPRMAIFQVHSQTKLSARLTSDRLKVVVDAFSAFDITRATAFRLQAKSLAKIAAAVHSEIASVEDAMEWETKHFLCRTSHNLERVTKGLTSLRKTLVGLELALQADLASPMRLDKQRRLLGRSMRDSLIYVTDWVCLALRHASADIKQQTLASHTNRQVIIEEGNEVLFSFDEALYTTRQDVGYTLATQNCQLDKDNYVCTMVPQTRCDSDDESHGAHVCGIFTPPHLDADHDGSFSCSDSEMVETMCNAAKRLLEYRISDGDVGNGGEIPFHDGCSFHLRGGGMAPNLHEPSCYGLHFSSSLMPHTMGALLSFGDQAAASFFLFNVKKFVEDTRDILESAESTKMLPESASKQQQNAKLRMFDAPCSAGDHSDAHVKVQIASPGSQHYLRTSRISSQPTSPKKPPSRKLSSVKDKPVSFNKVCKKCASESSSTISQSNVTGESKGFCLKRVAAYMDSAKPGPQQLRTALKISLAMGIGAFLGFWFNQKKGYWADITLALGFTGAAKGGSFKIAVLRTLGTVSGSIYGLVVVLSTFNFPVLRLLSLIPWVVLTSFLRQSKIFGYAGAVSAFTGAIVILARTNKDSTDQDFTVVRIVEAFLGMASFLIVELLVLPRRAASMVKPEMISGLGKLQEFVSDIFEAYASGHCNMCGGSKAIDELKSKEAKLRKLIASQNALVKEAAEEPQFWFAPFPNKIFTAVMEEQGKIMEMLHFSIIVLEEIKQVAKEASIPMDRLLQAPLKAAMTIMEEKVVPTLAFLAKVLALKAQQGVPTEETHSLHMANLAEAAKSSSEDRLDVGHRFVELEGLMMAEATVRNSSLFKHCQFSDVATKRERRFMDEFEKGALHLAYELAALQTNTTTSPATCPWADGNNNSATICRPQVFDTLSNTLVLSLGTLAFAMNGLLHHTTELEKVVHELLQEENPWNLIDFWDTSKSMGHLWPK